MCAITGILNKFEPSPRPRGLWKAWKNLTLCAPSPGPRKSWEKPYNLRPIPRTPEILEKNSQFAPHPSPRPRNLWKSCAKTSQSAPHPRDPRKSQKKPHNLTHLLVGCWLFRQAVQRPPAGANMLTANRPFPDVEHTGTDIFPARTKGVAACLCNSDDY